MNSTKSGSSKCCKANRTEPANLIVQAVIRAVTEFAAGAPQADDITLLVAKRL